MDNKIIKKLEKKKICDIILCAVAKAIYKNVKIWIKLDKNEI